jgi:anti-sigma factor RsiW
MKSCREYEEMVVLDAHGELDSSARAAWEAHLQTCGACREERLRLLKMLAGVKENLLHPTVLPGQTEYLVRFVRSGLSRETKATRGWREFFLGRPFRLMPAMASLCVLVIALYIFGLRAVEGPTRIQTDSDSKPWGELRAEDIEIIKNMDLLTEMDWVQRLVQAIDESDDGTPTSKLPGKTQGSVHYEGLGNYA